MLTAKQEKFVQEIIAGKSQADAYRSAYNTARMSDNAIYREASLLMSNPKVAQRLADIVAKVEKPTIMTAEKRMEWLTGVVSGSHITQDKLRAIDIMNKMEGLYVQRISGEIKMKKLEDLL